MPAEHAPGRSGKPNPRFEPVRIVESDEHRFNTDLLVDEGDQRKARRRYPDLFHVLYHEALVKKFLHHDDIANQAGAALKRWGVTAVALTAVGLTALTARLLWAATSADPVPGVLVYGSEASLLLAFLIPLVGIRSRRLRSRWLRHRLMTERLRQWHFQDLLLSGAEIEASCREPIDRAAIAAFERDRNVRFERFLALMRDLDAKLHATVSDSREGLDFVHRDSTFAENSRILPRMFAAYQELRFQHQRDYAERKTSDSGATHRLSLVEQARCAEALGAWSLVGAIIVCGLVLVLHPFGFEFVHSPWIPAMALFLAIVSITVHLLQSGLGIVDELERYQRYAGSVGHLWVRFDEAEADPARRLHLMKEMEVASVEEMRSFMRTHHRARFIL